MGPLECLAALGVACLSSMPFAGEDCEPDSDLVIVEDTEPNLSAARGKPLRASSSQRSSDLTFCKVSANAFRHMTLQGNKPQPFDLHLQRFQLHELKEAEAVLLPGPPDSGEVCSLHNCNFKDLADSFRLWSSEAVHILPMSQLQEEAEDLLLRMAHAGAFSTSYYLPGPAPDELRELMMRGYVVQDRSFHEHYRMSRAGSDLIHAAIKVSYPKTVAEHVDDYAIRLGLPLEKRTKIELLMTLLRQGWQQVSEQDAGTCFAAGGAKCFCVGPPLHHEYLHLLLLSSDAFSKGLGRIFHGQIKKYYELCLDLLKEDPNGQLKTVLPGKSARYYMDLKQQNRRGQKRTQPHQSVENGAEESEMEIEVNLSGQVIPK